MRPAREGDREALVPLLAEGDAVHAGLSPGYFVRPSVAERPARVGELLRQVLAADDRALFVAEHDRRICGLSLVRLYDTPGRPEMVSSRRGHLEELVVAEHWRRRGYGRALLAACHEWAKRRGAAELVLTVWAGNTGAERFYAALGYKPINQVLGTTL